MSGLTDDELALVAQLTDELEIEPMELQDALACLSTSDSIPMGEAASCAPLLCSCRALPVLQPAQLTHWPVLYRLHSVTCNDVQAALLEHARAINWCR